MDPNKMPGSRNLVSNDLSYAPKVISTYPSSYDVLRDELDTFHVHLDR